MSGREVGCYQAIAIHMVKPCGSREGMQSAESGSQKTYQYSEGARADCEGGHTSTVCVCRPLDCQDIGLSAHFAGRVPAKCLQGALKGLCCAPGVWRETAWRLLCR